MFSDCFWRPLFSYTLPSLSRRNLLATSTRWRYGWTAIGWVLIGLNLGLVSQSHGQTSDRVENRIAKETIAARCLGIAIRTRPLEQQLLIRIETQALERTLSPAAREQARKLLLEQAIDQILVVEALRKLGNVAGPNEVQWEYDRLREQLDREGSTIADYLDRWQLTDEELRRELAWRIVWRRDGLENLTDPVLEELYQRRREEFDGTERMVSQILFSIEDGNVEAARQQATAVRQELEAGKISWEQAVDRYSSGAAKSQAGRLGWIRFNEPMPPEFNRVAFALAPQTVSEPLVTKFGVHLVRVTEIKPGKFQFQDVRDAVLSAARQERFENLAAPLRQSTSIEYIK